MGFRMNLLLFYIFYIFFSTILVLVYWKTSLCFFFTRSFHCCLAFHPTTCIKIVSVSHQPNSKSKIRGNKLSCEFFMSYMSLHAHVFFFNYYCARFTLNSSQILSSLGCPKNLAKKFYFLRHFKLSITLPYTTITSH